MHSPLLKKEKMLLSNMRHHTHWVNGIVAISEIQTNGLDSDFLKELKLFSMLTASAVVQVEDQKASIPYL